MKMLAQGTIPKEVVDEWLNSFESKATRRAYWHDVCVLSVWMASNNLTIKSIKLKDLQQWNKNTGVGCPARRMIATVKSFWKYAYNQDFISKDISKCLKIPPKLDIRVERKLTKQQISTMINRAWWTTYK